MKQAMLRKLSGGLLLLLAVGITAGALTAIGAGKEEEQKVSVSLSVGQGRELALYDVRGRYMARLRGNEEGLCHTGLLPVGDYYLAWEGGMGFFRTDAQGLADFGGAVEGAEGVLTLTGEARGSVSVRTRARGTWYSYALRSGEGEYRQELDCQEGEDLVCLFSDLPLGKYSLEENGRALCTIELREENAHVIVELP